LIHLEKTRPVVVLESRRASLLKWIEEGKAETKRLEEEIAQNNRDEHEMKAELDQIEAALTLLQSATPKDDDEQH
jgi:septal ring factor EnvC (AmiA/AmiB activator)